MWSEQADSHHNDNGGGDDGDGDDDDDDDDDDDEDEEEEEEQDKEEQLQLCIWKELPWMPVAKQPPANGTWLVTSLLAMRLAACMSTPKKKNALQKSTVPKASIVIYPRAGFALQKKT